MQNHGYCNACNTLVPAETVERDGKIFLVKRCPDCGENETLVSGAADRYRRKHEIDLGFEYGTCRMNCLDCDHGKKPNIVFVDITNRCNLNCPICINNTPSMGFLFEPPIEYFEEIFKDLANSYEHPPSVQVFGGEPTVRKDLFDIVKMAKSYGISTRVVTNGIKLADREYAQAFRESRASCLIAYDGKNTELYELMRGSSKMLSKKEEALRNIKEIGFKKAVLMTLVAKGFNDTELPEIFQLAHDLAPTVYGINFMPLAHTWKQEDFGLEADRITEEDVEAIVDAAFPDDKVEFLPASFLGQVHTMIRSIWITPPPFAGAHPNCESMYLLVSDGEKYVPFARFIRGSVYDLAKDFIEAEKRLGPMVDKLEASNAGRLRRAWVNTRIMLSLTRIMVRHMKFGRLFKGRGPGKLWHALCLPLAMLFGRKSKAVAKHTNWQGMLQLIILPFEDHQTLETHRMERCPSAFAYYDPEEKQVHYIPVCAWSMHKTGVMKRITEFYDAQKAAAEPAAS